MVENLSDMVSTAGAVVGGGAIGAYSVWRYFRNTMSRDQVGINRDRAETGIISVLQEQAMQDRARAVAAEKDRNDAMVEIGKLQGQVTALSALLEAVKEELHETREELKATRDEFRVLIGERDRLLKIILEGVKDGNKLAQESHDALCGISLDSVPPAT